MSKAITIAQAQSYDAHTINEIGIPAMVLMERAALATFNNLLNDDYDLTRVVVVAATGNNGGDGIAVARLLKVRNIDVAIYLLGDPTKATDQTAQQLKIANLLPHSVHHGSKRRDQRHHNYRRHLRGRPESPDYR
jgi:Uncharacterized conserved protein